jgi:hypothetical protein
LGFWFRETHFFVPDAMHEALPVSPVLKISSGLGIINTRELWLLLCKKDIQDTPRPYKTTRHETAHEQRHGNARQTLTMARDDKTGQTKTV